MVDGIPPGAGERPGNTPQIIVPSPDPTELTTKSLQREIYSLRELLEARIASIEKLLERAEQDIRSQDSVIDIRVGHLHELTQKSLAVHDEKFKGISLQFTERDVRVEQTSKDTKVAVDAALQAAEKAVGKQNESFAIATTKSETATTKQIDQMVSSVQATTNSLNDKIEDAKSRIADIKDDLMKEIVGLRESNSRGAGAGNQAATHKADAQYLGLLVVAMAGVVIATVAYFVGKS